MLAREGADSVGGYPSPLSFDWLSCECKDSRPTLTQAQEREADRLRNSGGLFVVVRELGRLDPEALAGLEGGQALERLVAAFSFRHFGGVPNIGKMGTECASGKGFDQPATESHSHKHVALCLELVRG